MPWDRNCLSSGPRDSHPLPAPCCGHLQMLVMVVMLADLPGIVYSNSAKVLLMLLGSLQTKYGVLVLVLINKNDIFIASAAVFQLTLWLGEPKTQHTLGSTLAYVVLILSWHILDPVFWTLRSPVLLSVHWRKQIHLYVLYTDLYHICSEQGYS